MWQTFRPTIMFLLKFGLTYGILSALYGWYLHPFEAVSPPAPDGVTIEVRRHTVWILDVLGYEAAMRPHTDEASVLVSVDGIDAVRIFQGCNGMSMFILFAAFIIAFTGTWRRTLWFIPAGLVFIHGSNLARLVALSLISLHYPQHMYFFHKYGFTIIIYVSVFLLWVLWVGKVHRPRALPQAAAA